MTQKKQDYARVSVSFSGQEALLKAVKAKAKLDKRSVSNYICRILENDLKAQGLAGGYSNLTGQGGYESNDRTSQPSNSTSSGDKSDTSRDLVAVVEKARRGAHQK